MFGGDDDEDFMPAINSKLASLFSSKSGSNGNASLTYTAPKQPKRAGNSNNDVRSSKTQTSAASSNINNSTQSSAANKLGIIIVKAVNTYKLEDGSYNLQGKLGAAVLGNAAICVYQLLLYKGKQHHITSTKITPKFQFTVQPNNYGTFYDDQKQNWSIHFEHDEDAEEFAKEIGLARGNSQGGNGAIHDLLSQDLSTGEGPAANVGDSMEIFYSVRLFTESKLGQLVESNVQSDKPQRVKIRKQVWEEGLIGATKGSKRIILLPPSLVGPWKQAVPADASVCVEVAVGRLKQARAAVDSGESAIDSGADDQSIRARGEALTSSPKSQRAKLVSRMARMGQATLPLKGAVTCDPSDTDESDEEANNSTKPPLVFKPSAKVRAAKATSLPAQLPSPSETHAGGTVNMSVPPQQMAVYQPLPGWQQQSQAFTVSQFGISQLDGQLYPLVPGQKLSSHHLMSAGPPPPAGTPPDGHLSVFLSETRTQNTEIRIGMAKVADKVDQVLAKLDSTAQTLRPSTSSGLLDPTSLLASIQRLVSENEQLKSDVTEKGNKIDVQSDRIYQLLNTNHKYLEQSNSSSESQEAELAGLRVERARLLAELAGAREEVADREVGLKALTERLRESREAREDREKTVARLVKTLSETRDSNSELGASLGEMASRLERKDEEIARLNAKHSARLEELRARECDTVSGPPSQRAVGEEVKKVMNLVYRSLHREFVDGRSYAGESVKQTLMVTIRDVTCQLVEREIAAPRAGSSEVGGRKETSQSGEEVVGSKLTENNDPGDESAVTSRDLSVVSSDPAPVRDDIARTDMAGSSSEGVRTPEPGFNPVGQLNPTADGPKDMESDSSSAMMSNYAGGNAGDIPTVHLTKLPGEMDLSVKLVPTDSDTVPEPLGHLRVTSDSCVLSSPPTPRAQDDNSRHESMSAVRPVTAPTATDVTASNLREALLETEPWRSEPPPLFDDDEDEDDWLS